MDGRFEVVTTNATVADVPHLAGVQLAAALAGFADIFPDSLPKPTQRDLEKEWAALLDLPEATVLSAWARDRIVAGVVFGHFPLLVPDGFGHLAKLYVSPSYAGSGIGAQLHDIAVDGLRAAGYDRLWLWVLEGNARARAMYERRGWSERKERRTDYPGSGVFEMGYVLEF